MAQCAARNSTFRGEFVERCRTIRQIIEDPNLARDEQMLCRHEAHCNAHNGVGCNVGHYHASLWFPPFLGGDIERQCAFLYSFRRVGGGDGNDLRSPFAR
jgi:hypothetical protein